jgi:hypothetical protein
MKIAFPFILLLLFCGELKSQGVTISNLPDGHKIHVRYSSQGCFHFNTYEFDFVGGSVIKLNIVKVDRKWNKKQNSYDDFRHVRLGSLILSNQDVYKLDRLISYYRSKPEGICTTSDSIDIVYYADGKQVSSESYTDASCSSSEMKNILTFNELVSRIK